MQIVMKMNRVMHRWILLLILALAAGTLHGQETLSAGLSSPVQAGTELYGSQPDLKVFPNPVLHKKFTVEITPHLIREIKITNIAGVQVYNKKFTVPVQRYEITPTDLPDGIYLLRVSNTANSAKTLKLVISSAR